MNLWEQSIASVKKVFRYAYRRDRAISKFHKRISTFADSLKKLLTR